MKNETCYFKNKKYFLLTIVRNCYVQLKDTVYKIGMEDTRKIKKVFFELNLKSTV